MRQTLLASAACIALFAFPSSAQADDAGVKALQERLDAQERRIRELEARLEARAVEPPTVAASVRPAPAPAIAPVKTEPTVKLRGRMQIDALVLNESDTLASPTGTQVRRFYIGVEGKLTPTIRYVAEADFGGNRVALQDVFVAYRLGETTELAAGYFKPPNTIDDLTSDTVTLFLERSAFATSFSPGRRVGAGTQHWGRDWGVRAGVWGERDDALLDDDRKEGWLASARVHRDFLPGAPTLHVAVSSYYMRPSDSEPSVRIAQKPEANRALTVIDTGALRMDRGLFLGAEAGLGLGPVTVQGEAGRLKLRGPDSSPAFWGYSAQVGYRWTGETRPYDVAGGTFGRVTPSRSVADGGAGGFETGLRLTHVDLSDVLIDGGRMTSYGLVLNWFPLSKMRLGANYIHAEIDRAGASATEDLVALRGQIEW